MVGSTAVEAEADVGRERDDVVGVQLPLSGIFGIGVKRHLEPVGGPATGEIVEGCQACGLVDGQFLAVEKLSLKEKLVMQYF